MMKTKILVGCLAVFFLVYLTSCLDKKDPMSVPTHPEGWKDRGTSNFHGLAIANGSLTQESCTSCHGVDYKGGTSGVACSSCHIEFPHPQGWAFRSSDAFHGGQLLDGKLELESCQSCHGKDYQGGTSGGSCYKCHDQYPHPSGWVEISNMKFHGNFILTDELGLDNCQSCHGEDYSGGTSKIACAKCHAGYPHPEGFADKNSADFHSVIIADKLKWNILACQDCHGQDYAGQGWAQKNCLTCHTAADGPEACNTCHGSDINNAPPVDLSKNTSTTTTGVGAHQPHVMGTTWSTFSSATCQTCHKEPLSYSDEGHIKGQGMAEVKFNSLADFGGKANTTWDRINGSCDNVYCHGAFEFKKEDSHYQWAYTDSMMSGNNAKVFWKFQNTGQAFCGTCHGLPPQGHVPATACNGCHNSVVDENFNIINKYLHINGEIDVF